MKHTAIVLGALGDFLLTLPLLCQLRQGGPVAIVSRGAYRALLPEPLADAIFIDIDSAKAAPLFAENPGTLPHPLMNVVRDTEIHAFMRPARSVHRALSDNGAREAVWHDTRPAAPPHIVVRFFQEAGIAAPDDLLDTPIMPRTSVPDARTIWIHAGSGSAAKTIPPKDIVQRMAQTSGRGGHTIVSFGEADLELQKPYHEAFAAKSIAPEWVVLPTLRELRRRLESEATAFIGADTGVTHLAAALGIPTTALFRATNPAIWRPVGPVQVELVP